MKHITRFKLVDVIVELGISFIIMPILLGIALTNMAAQSTAGWSDTTVLMWGLMGMIFITACIIAVISHAKYAGKIP
jgi:heme/copper-type cytochrome/quinol oxidase subunit 2